MAHPSEAAEYETYARLLQERARGGAAPGLRGLAEAAVADIAAAVRRRPCSCLAAVGLASFVLGALWMVNPRR